MYGKIKAQFQNSLMAEQAEAKIHENLKRVSTSKRILGNESDYKLSSNTIYPILPIFSYPPSVMPEPLQVGSDWGEQSGAFVSENAVPLIESSQATLSVVGEVNDLVEARDILIQSGGYSLKLDI